MLIHIKQDHISLCTSAFLSQLCKFTQSEKCHLLLNTKHLWCSTVVYNSVSAVVDRVWNSFSFSPKGNNGLFLMQM